MRAGIYARVSTSDQTTENQLIELRRYVGQRGWEVAEFIEEGVSGMKERRPQLDRLLTAARRRHVDVVVVWSLDRLGRSLKHLVTLMDDLQELGVAFVSIREGLDWTTPSGRLQAQLLGMIAEFERGRLQERVHAGLARARRQGKRLGRPPRPITTWELTQTAGLSIRAAARELKVSASALHRARQTEARGATNEPISETTAEAHS
jgi:DNA invertase Pin-like site-specific DNA recombinase